MKILFQIILVALLITSGIAALLSFQNFNKKTEIKGRTIGLEQGIKTLAKNLAYEDSLTQINTLEGMKTPLKKLAQHAISKQEDVVRLDGELQDANDQIAGLADDLDAAKKTADTAKTEAARIAKELDQSKNIWADAKKSLEPLNEKIKELEGQVGDLEDNIAKKEDDIADKDSEIKALNDENDTMSAKVARLLDDSGDTTTAIEGLSGNILSVNSEWNYVVLDLGKEDQVIEDYTALIHRGEELIGKVRISKVDEHLSIGALIMDWKNDDPEVGDSIFF